MNGIHYITDPKGKRVSVVLDLRKHGEAWEDFYDALLAKQTVGDALMDWEEAKQKLRQLDAKPKHAAKRQYNPVKRSKIVKK